MSSPEWQPPTQDLRFERPSAKLAESFAAMRDAFMAVGDDRWPGPREIAHRDAVAYADVLQAWSEAKQLPDGFVRSDSFWIVRDDVVLGECQVRHVLTPALERIGGNIGYHVHPSYRNEGLATYALREALRVAAGIGIGEALLTCVPDNGASIRVIEKLGGRRIADTVHRRYLVPTRRTDEAMHDVRNVHIFGASGAGKTTLAKALAAELGLRHTDTDEAYFIPTDPPFQHVRPVEERLAILRTFLTTPPGTVFGGALSGWGNPLTPLLSGVVWLDTPTPVRIERLERREIERYGEAILSGGSRCEESRAFITWAAAYDAGAADGRSRKTDEAWLQNLPCPLLHLDGTRPADELVLEVIAWVKTI